MYEENISKRPTTSKNAQLRPITGRPKASIQNNKNREKNYQNNLLTLNNNKRETKLITESIDEYKNENEIQNLNEEEKTQFLEVLGEEGNRDTFDNILSHKSLTISSLSLLSLTI